MFGTDVIAKFLQTHDLDLMARAHQVVEDGEFFFILLRIVVDFFLIFLFDQNSIFYSNNLYRVILHTEICK